MSKAALREQDRPAFRAARGTRTITEVLWSSAACVRSWLRPSDPRDLAAAAAGAAAFAAFLSS